METFSALLAICAGNSVVTGESPAQRPVTWSFGVFFDLRLTRRLSKQWWGWWFETPACPLWRHRYDSGITAAVIEPLRLIDMVIWVHSGVCHLIINGVLYMKLSYRCPKRNKLIQRQYLLTHRRNQSPRFTVKIIWKLDGSCWLILKPELRAPLDGTWTPTVEDCVRSPGSRIIFDILRSEQKICRRYDLYSMHFL